MHKKKMKGFTLIELIVCMTIIVILAGLVALYVFSYFEKSKKEAANSGAKVVYNAAIQYLTDQMVNNNDVSSVAPNDLEPYLGEDADISGVTSINLEDGTVKSVTYTVYGYSATYPVTTA